MATTLSATGRITMNVTVTGFLHKLRVYARNPQAVGGSFNINSRALDNNDIVWTDALNDLCTCTSWILGTGHTMGDGVLEHYSGGVWSVYATATPVYTNHASAVPSLGWQATYVLRDLLFRKVKVELIEGAAGTLTHYASLAAMGASNTANFAKEFTASKTLTNAPYNWMVGRGNQYLNTAPFVGFTFTTNRRVRRRRGLT